MNQEERDLIVNTIHSEMQQEMHHPDTHVPFFKTKKAMHRCFLVLVMLALFQIGIYILHVEMCHRLSEFATDSLMDFLLFGTVEE